MSDETYLELPLDPDQIGVNLSPPEFRSFDFSALDFETARRSIFEYIRTYYPNDFNDFVASNGVVMLAEIQASNSAKLALRADMLANEAFLPTATTEEAVINHLALINQRIRRATPAVVDVEVSVPSPVGSDINVPAGTVLRVRGPNSSTITYELYKAPGDFTNPITIPSGKRGVVAYGLEGRSVGPIRFTSPGSSNQSFTISESSILEEPFIVRVGGDDPSYEWKVTTDPLELYDANDRVAKVSFYSDRAVLTFGDDRYGKAPVAGQTISVSYRVGGGIRGRISTGAINELKSISPAPPFVSPVQVAFRNITPSSGGLDQETLEEAKRRAPRDFTVRAFASDRPASIITESDYVQVATTFSHPVYGSVAKAAVMTRTELNANRIELYVLANGPNGLVTPSSGLKMALATYIDRYNPMTDQTFVFDGAIRPVDIDATVVVKRDADVTFVRTSVENAINTLMSINTRDMGQPLYVSDIIQAMKSVNGVSYVDLFSPADNILSGSGVKPYEIVVEGSRNIKYYYEP